MSRFIGSFAATLAAVSVAVAQGPASLPPLPMPVAATPAVFLEPQGPDPSPSTSTPPNAAGDKSSSSGAPGQSGGATPAPAARSFEAVWNNGLFFQTKDKDFVFHVGGAVQYDGAWYTAPASLEKFPGGTGPYNDGVNQRRGRLRADGTLYKNVDFAVEYEFFNGVLPAGLPATAANVFNSPGPTDAWITLKNIPVVGNVRIGNQKEPFSLEHLNNYRALEFLERSVLFDASQATRFNNGFTPGVSVFRTWADDRIYTAGGFFKNESDLFGFGVNDGNYATTGRVGILPIYDPESNVSLWIGGAMSYRNPVNGQVRVNVRENVRNAPFPLLNLPADTGVLNASSQSLYNLETGAAIGPVTIQAEYLANLVRDAGPVGGPNVGTAVFQGFYAETMVFLTGERRTWNPKAAVFNRIQPLTSFGFSSDGTPTGIGAWELAVRYSYLDLTDKTISGGRLNSVTLGLNWYLNANAKLQFNYDYTYRDNAANPFAKGEIHAVGTRMAFDF